MKINQYALTTSIVKAAKLSFEEKEAVVDEILAEQPNLLASVVVQPQLGNSVEHTGVLLSILIVSHLALKEADIKLVEISEDDQDRELKRFVGQVKFTEDLPSSIVDQLLQQYIDAHDEQPLLAYAHNEMVSAGLADIEAATLKYLILAGFNIVNCIAEAKIAQEAAREQRP